MAFKEGCCYLNRSRTFQREEQLQTETACECFPALPEWKTTERDEEGKSEIRDGDDLCSSASAHGSRRTSVRQRPYAVRSARRIVSRPAHSWLWVTTKHTRRLIWNNVASSVFAAGKRVRRVKYDTSHRHNKHLQGHEHCMLFINMSIKGSRLCPHLTKTGYLLICLFRLHTYVQGF